MSAFRLSLFVLASLAGLLTACAPGGPVETQPTVDAAIAIVAAAEARDRAAAIQMTTSVETVYYELGGRTTAGIFRSMEAHSPEIEGGKRGYFAAGLAAFDRRFEPVVSLRRSYCEIESAIIHLRIVMTLPRHSTPQRLTPHVLSAWQAFEFDTTEHENRHADIALRTMEKFKHELANDYGQRFSSCNLLVSTLNADWALAWEVERQEQDAFHIAEEERSKELRGPVQLQIDRAKSALDQLQEQLDRSSATVGELEARMEVIQSSYPDLVLPPNVFRDYESLRAQLNGALPSHNRIVAEFNRLATDIAGWHEELAWLP